MATSAYERLAEALDRLPNGFSRTPSNAEIPLLQRIFSPQEAKLAAELTGDLTPAPDIAAHTGAPVKDTRAHLMQMVRRGLVWFDRAPGQPRFRLAPFVVGIFEAQLGDMDHELAHLVEQYMADGGAAGIMQPGPAIHRVVPAQDSVKSEWILPYEDARAIVESCRTFSVRDCICRVQQDALQSRRCDVPLLNCLGFSSVERDPRPGDISREEALDILEQTEEAGLVHSVSDVLEGLGYMCNCCGCCCAVLRGITDWGIEHSVAAARYLAVVDADACTACGACEDRCQVHAISVTDGSVTVSPADGSIAAGNATPTPVEPVLSGPPQGVAVASEACIGCGLCVSTCPSDAIQLQPRPDADALTPPTDFADWERQRLLNRNRVT